MGGEAPARARDPTGAPWSLQPSTRCQTTVPARICPSEQPPSPCAPAPGRPMGTHPPCPSRTRSPQEPRYRCYSWRGDGHGFPRSRLIELSAEPNFPGDLTPSSPSAERSRSNRGAWPELSGRLEDGTVLPSSELAAPRGNCAPLHAQPGKEPRMGAASLWMRVDGWMDGRSHGGGLRGSWPWVLFLAVPGESRAVGCQEGWDGAPTRDLIPKLRAAMPSPMLSPQGSADG